MAAFTTKPKGIHATFSFTCVTCGAECMVTNSRPDPHECRIELPERPITLADIRAALERKNPGI